MVRSGPGTGSPELGQDGGGPRPSARGGPAVGGAEDPGAHAEHLEVAHELRAAVASMAANVELITDPRLGTLTDDQRECAVALDIGLRRLAELIENAVLASAMHGGWLDLDMRPLDLGELVALAVHEFAPRCSAAGQHLVWKPPRALPLVTADRTSVRRVVENLLGNAQAYTPSGGTISVRLWEESGGRQVVIEVADTGIGMTPEEMARAEEPFYRAERARTMRSSGRGLGLCIVRGLVSMHHGRVWFDGAPDGGTVVRTALPVDARDAPPERAPLPRRRGKENTF